MKQEFIGTILVWSILLGFLAGQPAYAEFSTYDVEAFVSDVRDPDDLFNDFGIGEVLTGQLAYGDETQTLSMTFDEMFWSFTATSSATDVSEGLVVGDATLGDVIRNGGLVSDQNLTDSEFGMRVALLEHGSQIGALFLSEGADATWQATYMLWDTQTFTPVASVAFGLHLLTSQTGTHEPVPEPATVLLMIAGLVIVVAAKKRRILR